MKRLYRNGLELPVDDAHIYQRRGTVLAYKGLEPLHFTVLKCRDGKAVRTYFGAARADSLSDFETIMDYGDKISLVTAWLGQSTS
ncbi:hypothetical protein F9L16_20025 [Agarivorans sp. B2Z047]|uniref:hypothetical protein n=1 Tax=Agarivorans sp. B2Z047 TaxID=2652721 RepID=UPI00128C75D6|nr:hypothetical protein [Agarivorans sp. B2Z047]MPW31265.1 hypothetical protein [Agarivorans sp. B2Z047]UQN42769.1 hypothetical protein LQZ07_23840 [Agarivorans sp. B2Z047]